MAYYPRSNDTMDKLLALGKGAYVLDGWQFNDLEKGCIIAVARYGHHSAARMMAKAKLPIYAALRLIQIAFKCGAKYRRPMHSLFNK